MVYSELKELLDIKYEQYNNPAFIEDDPVSIPHKFGSKEDIEIAAFLTATISWGQRASIIKSASGIMERMDWAPYDFIMNHQSYDLDLFKGIKHRTFKHSDCSFFMSSLQNIYKNHNGLESIFAYNNIYYGYLQAGIVHFRDVFFSISHEQRTRKHIPDIVNGSAGKRLNMFLRWMVRNDKKGVDFGLWKSISPANLYLPLDVHTANASRKLGLLTRNSNDWKAVLEVTQNLRLLDADDPVKYDFALFGLSIHKQI